MSKECLEALERLAMPDELHIKECEKLGIGLTEDYDMLKQYFEAIDTVKSSEALECLKKIGKGHTYYDGELISTEYEEEFNIIEQALIQAKELEAKNKKLELAIMNELLPIGFAKALGINQPKKEQAWDYLVKHFNIKCDINSMPSGEVWARFVNIQAKEDEGEWDCTASANLVNYEEDFDLLKEMCKNGYKRN